MGEAIILKLDGDPALAVTVRHASRARRISLRVSRLDGRVTLTLPDGTPRRLAETFLLERADWLRAALDSVGPRLAVAPGVDLPIEGQALRLVRAPVRRVLAEGTNLLIPERGRPGALVAAWARQLARVRIAPAIAHHATRLGAAARRPPRRLRLADPRGRWGSCSSAGDLMLSWRLILAPPAVLDYVVAHEVAHLAQMNHSAAFWDEVARLVPDHARHRTWLRTHGSALHRYDFDAA